MVQFDAKQNDERMDEVLAAAKRAIELDDQDANSYFTIGRVHLAHLFRGEIQDAVVWARRAVQTPNAQYWSRAHLAAAVRDLMQKKPEFSLDFAREHLFYLKQSDQIETYIEWLRKAGVN